MKFTLAEKLKLSTLVMPLIVLFLTLNYSDHISAKISSSHQDNVIRVSSTTGNNSGDCGSEATPCQTIQFAIQNRANSGDTILVAAGTYTYDQGSDICQVNLGTTGAVCVINKEITLRGGYSLDNWSEQNGANTTIIDGGNTLRGVLVISTGPTTSLVMDGFIVQNGLAQSIPLRAGTDDATSAFGGGMFVDSAQSVTLNNITFRASRAIGMDSGTSFGGSGAGGALALRGVNATLTNVNFEENQAVGGAGSDRGGYGTGGGIHTFRATVNGSNLQFFNNVSQGGNTAGSGVDNNGYRGDALGAGASFQDDSVITVQNIIARGNQAVGGNSVTHSGGAFGAGIFVEKAIATFTDVELRGNIARGGEATNAWLGRGGGAEFIDSVVEITNIIAIENQAIGGDGTNGDKGSGGGGGLSATWTFRDDARLDMTNALIAGNFVNMGEGTNVTGGGGAGLWIQAVQANMTHVTVANNRLGSVNMSGAGILLIEVGQRVANGTLAHSIIADHQGSNAAIHVRPSNILTLSRGLWSNNSDDFNGNISGGETMLSGDAGFVNSGNYEYQITSPSAAIDQAIGSSTALDLDSRPREGNGADLGAYEAVAIIENTPTPSSTATPVPDSPSPTVTPVPDSSGTGDQEKPALNHRLYLPLVAQ